MSPRFILAGLVGLFLSACDASPEVRFRITVEIDDNGTMRSGSSVWKTSLLSGFPSGSMKLVGDAVAVDIPGRGTLFALMIGSDDEGQRLGATMEMLPITVFRRTGHLAPLQDGASHEGEEIMGFIRNDLQGARADLDCRRPLYSECPFLVRFRNIEDPLSVEVVERDNLSGSFGEGVSLQRIYIEIADDPITLGIEKVLPWLNGMTGPLDGTSIMFADGKITNRVGSGDFRQGTN